MMVSGFVLLIVCANVANLMLVRGMERRRQTSLSMALGARASRLVRQALTESILLSLFGGAAGLAIAFAGTRLILHFAFPSSPRIRPACPSARRPPCRCCCLRSSFRSITGSGFRHCSRMDGHPSRSDRSASRRQPLHCPHRLAPAEDASGVAGGAVAGFAIRVGAAHRRAAQPGESRFRIRSGPAHRGEHRSTACRLSDWTNSRRSTGASTIPSQHSGRIVSGSLHLLAANRRQLGLRRLGGWTPAPGPQDDILRRI